MPNSYGYRPHKSAHQAIAKVRENVRQYAWVINMDIQRFFEEVSHELLLESHSQTCARKMGVAIHKKMVRSAHSKQRWINI
jgi:retron-type reverse transcriptase